MLLSLLTAATLLNLPIPSLCQTPENFSPASTTPLIISFNGSLVTPNAAMESDGTVVAPPQLFTLYPLSNDTEYVAVLVDPSAGTPTEHVEVLHYILPNLRSGGAPHAAKVAQALQSSSRDPPQTTTANSSSSESKALTKQIFPLATASKPLAEYLVPNPPPNSPGTHTYTITLWGQPKNFSVPMAYQSFLPLNEKNLTNRYPFNLTAFASAAGLGSVPAAAGVFDVQSSGGTSASTSNGGTTTFTSMSSAPAGAATGTGAAPKSSNAAAAGPKRDFARGAMKRRSLMGLGVAGAAAVMQG